MSYQPTPIDANGRVAADDIILGVTDVVDATNSSTTPLLAGATFTGTSGIISNYKQISVFVFSDQASAANGLQIQFSTDGSNWDHTHYLTVAGGVSDTIQAHCHTKYYRVLYTNGGVNQTQFRLQTILRPIAGIGTIIEADDAPRFDDDAILTKSILTGKNSVTGNTYVDAKMTPDGGLIINQDILIDASNSSTANLAAGAFYTGAASSNITATAIQIFLKTDQNCNVYLEQSQNGVNWDVSDQFSFFSAIGNFANTTNAVGAYYRVRVQNIGPTTTTYFRLQTITVPILGALPRSLSPQGWLQTAINHVEDDTGFVLGYSPFGEMTTAKLTRIVGSGFFGSTLDTNFWTPSTGTGGTVQNTSGLLTLATGTTANNSVNIQSVHNSRYVAGSSSKARMAIQLPDTGTVNNVRRWGCFNATDGVFFQLDGTSFSLVTRKNSIDTAVNNGAFNGDSGNFYTLDTVSRSFDILLSTTKIWFYIDYVLVHVMTFGSTWASTLNLPLRIENTNSGGSTTNVSINVFAAVVMRVGEQLTQPVAKQIIGAATTVLKYGAGNLHAIHLNANSGTSVTVYDNTAGSGTAITSYSFGGGFPGNMFDFKGISFSNGLTIVTVGTVNITVIYE